MNEQLYHRLEGVCYELEDISKTLDVESQGALVLLLAQLSESLEDYLREEA